MTFSFTVDFTPHQLAASITLLRASEVQDLVDGDDDKYKALNAIYNSGKLIKHFTIGKLVIVNYISNVFAILTLSLLVIVYNISYDIVRSYN